MHRTSIQNLEVAAYALRRRGTTICMLVHVNPPTQFYQLVSLKNFGVAERLDNYLAGARDVRGIAIDETITGKLLIIGSHPTATFKNLKDQIRARVGNESQPNLFRVIEAEFGESSIILDFHQRGSEQVVFAQADASEVKDSPTLLEIISSLKIHGV